VAEQTTYPSIQTGPAQKVKKAVYLSRRLQKTKFKMSLTEMRSRAKGRKKNESRRLACAMPEQAEVK
jgi:hypothetical protein